MAVRRVELARVSQVRNAERNEVGIGQRDAKGTAVGKVPRTMGAPRCFSRKVSPDIPFAKFCKPPATAPPLLPDHRPQSASEPLIKILKHRGCLAETEVAAPSTQVLRECLRSLLHADPSCPASQLSNALLKPQDCFRRNAPLRFLAARKAESEKLPSPRPSHCALRLVHLEFELRGEKPSDTFHHPLPGSLAADVDVAIVRVTYESMPTPL